MSKDMEHFCYNPRVCNLLIPNFFLLVLRCHVTPLVFWHEVLATHTYSIMDYASSLKACPYLHLELPVTWTCYAQRPCPIYTWTYYYVLFTWLCLTCYVT